MFSLYIRSSLLAMWLGEIGSLLLLLFFWNLNWLKLERESGFEPESASLESQGSNR